MPGDAGQTRLDQPEKVIVSFHMDLPAGRGPGMAGAAWPGEASSFSARCHFAMKGSKQRRDPPLGQSRSRVVRGERASAQVSLRGAPQSLHHPATTKQHVCTRL